MGNQLKIKVLSPKVRIILLIHLVLAGLLLMTPGVRAGTLIDALKDHPASIRGDNLKVPLLFRAIARQAGITVYVADNIDDTITIEMESRTLYDIFNLVVTAKHLRYYEKEGVLFIQKEEDFQSAPVNLATRRICSQYGRAEDYLEQLGKLLSKSGTITPTERGNCLLIVDLREQLDKVSAMFTELDRPIPQVYIEARIVIISDEAKRRLGIKWGFSDRYGDLSVTGAVDQQVSHTADLMVGYLRNNLNLNLELQALEQDNLARVLSSPRILVLDGKEAEIKQGKEVAYVTQTDSSINTSFREASLSLKVTPRILKNHYIVLDVSVTNDSVSTASSGGQPTIDTQEISSTLFLENNQTVVIGGILLENKDNIKQRVPLLGTIPILGNLFKSKDDSKKRYELQVFITPTILSMEDGNRPDPAGSPASAPPDARQLKKPAVTPKAGTAITTGPEASAREPVSTAGPPGAAEAGADNLAAPRPAADSALPDQVEMVSSDPEGPPLYTVQVGSFRKKANAEKMLNRIRDKGYTPYLAELTSGNGQIWYAVRLGDYQGWSLAVKHAGEFNGPQSRAAVVLPVNR
ncbi:MAG: SPOR domain-containing protein [Desulfobacterales bacterium]|nr:SPOR domain-containing protein [Desulfobacterales bacterium]